MTQHGYSFVELLIALGFVSMTLISVSTATIHAEHNLSAINQTLCAEQIVSNIATELFSTQNTWTAEEQNHWRTEATAWLPGATLHLNTNHIEVLWPSTSPITIHCQISDPRNSCLGLDLGLTEDLNYLLG